MKPVNGSFCRLCKKFLNEDTVDSHVKSKPHYDKFAATVAKKKKDSEEKEEERLKKAAELENSSLDDASAKVSNELAFDNFSFKKNNFIHYYFSAPPPIPWMTIPGIGSAPKRRRKMRTRKKRKRKNLEKKKRKRK